MQPAAREGFFGSSFRVALAHSLLHFKRPGVEVITWTGWGGRRDPGRTWGFSLAGTRRLAGENDGHPSLHAAGRFVNSPTLLILEPGATSNDKRDN